MSHYYRFQIEGNPLNNNNIIIIIKLCMPDMYARYVDDCALLRKEGTQNIVLHEMNSIDLFLNFTVENIQNNSLSFVVILILLFM